jgi:hypothetical protein
MALMMLEKSHWQTYFDRLSRVLVGKTVELEVVALDLGDQVEAQWLPLLGVDYDPVDDLFEIALDGVDHLIRRPSQIFIDEDGGVALSNLMIVDGEGRRHIAQFRDPLMLPPASTDSSSQQPSRR